MYKKKGGLGRVTETAHTLHITLEPAELRAKNCAPFVCRTDPKRSKPTSARTARHAADH